MTRLALVGAAVSFVACLVAANLHRIIKFNDFVSRVPRSNLAVFVLFATVATLSAQKPQGTNAPPNGASPPNGNVELKMENVELRNLSPLIENEQFRNFPFSILHSQFPTNAVRAERWWRRGAWEDVMRVEFPQGWVFPFGEDHLPFVDVVSQGSLRRRWTDTNEVASLGVRLALVPFSSVFWHEFTPSNSCRFVWSGALAERRADSPVDAAIELFRNGDVHFETNGVSWRTERLWDFGATNAIMDSAEAWAMAGGGGLFVFAVAFASAPPETICLCVGTNRVVVSDACECCFVLEKGSRHGISLSYVPDGVSFSWWEVSSSMRSPPRSGLVTERMEAFGSTGAVDFDDPSEDGSGSIFWDCSLYITPSSANDPSYPMYLSAYMDVPHGESPTISWNGDDGGISETGEWLTLEGPPASGMIGVTATWRGRTWRGSVVFWTDVEESVVALDGGGALFVESSYTNYPGEVTVRTSTQQKLTASWALHDYGPVTLSANEGAAVTVRADTPDGPVVELPYSWYGCAGDVGSMDLYVTNNDPSQGDSVEFMLEFDGEDGDYDCDYSGLLEVVRYRVEAKADWPSNKVRHVFGPTEKLDAVVENGQKFGFDAPLTPGVVDMSFDYNGSTCTFPIRVIPPNGIAGTLRAYDGDCGSSRIGAGFTAYLQVLPTYVSFKDLEIMEDEAGVSSRWGCFENLIRYPHDQFAHTTARGARNPLSIGEENMVDGYDHARTDFGELPSQDGGCAVNIPLKWGISGGPYSYDAGHVLQAVQVLTDGTVIVSKFGITARRKPNEDYQ